MLESGEWSEAAVIFAALIVERATVALALQGRALAAWCLDDATTVLRAREAGRLAMTAAHLPYLGARIAVRALTGKGSLERGMSMWHDYIDWLGGFPFEVASPCDVEQWLAEAGFTLQAVRTVGRRQGCNEYVFATAHAS